MFGFMCILLNKPAILFDSSGNFKSLNYLKFKLDNLHTNSFNNPNDFVSLPTISIFLALLSFYVAKQC